MILPVLYICKKFHENMCLHFNVAQQACLNLIITKGHNSIKICQVMVLNLCLFSDHACYAKIFQKVYNLLSG